MRELEVFTNVRKIVQYYGPSSPGNSERLFHPDHLATVVMKDDYDAIAAQLNQAIYELDKSRDSHTKKITELAAKLAIAVEALEEIKEHALVLSLFDPQSIIRYAENALSQIGGAE